MSTLTEAPPPLAPAEPTAKPPRKRGRFTPYWLLLPGILWLVVFFALPLVYQASTSVQTGSLEEGYKVTWHFATYWNAFSEYWPQFLRSIFYAAGATVLCLLLGYPLAYLIAFRAGRWRNLIMILVIAPFFTSFLIRTLAWKTILADNGPVVHALNSLHILDLTNFLGWTAGDRVLATPLAVVCGLTYNFLPFMILPLYTSLERIDGRLHEAEQAMLKFMLEFLAQYGRVSLGLTEEEELDDNNFPVTTTLYGKHDTPRIKLTDVYLTDDGEYLLADGIDAETGEKRDGFYIYSEQYADIFQFVGHASEMN